MSHKPVKSINLTEGEIISLINNFAASDHRGSGSDAARELIRRGHNAWLAEQRPASPNNNTGVLGVLPGNVSQV